VQVHPGVQFFVTSVFGTQAYNGDAILTLPKRMFVYISLPDSDSGTPGFLGWFGAGLAAVMVVVGFTIAVVMTRFDTFVLHQKGVDAFLSIPFGDMIVFGSCMAMAIYWRKKPEYHRRLVFIATCQLMDAALGRFDFMFNHNLFYPALDCLIVLGMVRDWVVDGRVHKVYLYALPAMMVLQSFAIYTWRLNPAWWAGITHVILGL
jgi:hypothetical protein